MVKVLALFLILVSAPIVNAMDDTVDSTDWSLTTTSSGSN